MAYRRERFGHTGADTAGRDPISLEALLPGRAAAGVGSAVAPRGLDRLWWRSGAVRGEYEQAGSPPFAATWTSTNQCGAIWGPLVQAGLPIVATESNQIRALSESTEDRDHPPPGRTRHVGAGMRRTLPDPPEPVADERIGAADS